MGGSGQSRLDYIALKSANLSRKVDKALGGGVIETRSGKVEYAGGSKPRAHSFALEKIRKDAKKPMETVNSGGKYTGFAAVTGKRKKKLK